MRSHRLERTVLALAACLPLAPVAGADETPLPGVWQKHEYFLSYDGFTSHYSCDGIADKVKLLLLAAGARDDAKVVGNCSNPVGGPSRISTARTTFYTLVPEPDAAAAVAPDQPAGAKPAAAPQLALGAWKAVEFRDRVPSWLEGGDCELVEQFDRELLPFFKTRNHESRMACVPHEYQLGSIAVRFEAFAPLPKPRSAPKAAPQ
jgi:hypothetical protein